MSNFSDYNDDRDFNFDSDNGDFDFNRGNPDRRSYSSRSERKSSQKKSRSQKFAEKIENAANGTGKKEKKRSGFRSEKAKELLKANKKGGKVTYREGSIAYFFATMTKKKALLLALLCCLVIGLIGIIYAGITILTAPKIDTTNIYSLLSQSSVLYDDNGEVMDTAYGDQNRTVVEISKVPKHVQNAFIALEDKTFRTHNGFNIVRIFGAIKDGLIHGHISGTSTITQQLARNLYLPDKMYERSLSRKITEAWYAIQLERKLNKDQIMEAYLNTIFFGCGYGIQTASQAYFSKDIEDVTLAEAACLAAMPQSPSMYALVATYDASEIDDDDPNLITKNQDYAYVVNDSCRDRQLTCLYLMKEQGYITDKEYEKAKAIEIKDLVKPNLDALDTISNYFADYVIDTVISDFQEEYGYSYEKAYDLVYNGGLQIYTTMDSQAQSVVDDTFATSTSFPTVSGYSKDKNNNILNKYENQILLYRMDNYIDDDGYFTLKKSEFKKNTDGSMTLYAGKRLNFYDTTVNDGLDISIEFKQMYYWSDDDVFYRISGGYVNIPQEYKSRDSEDNVVISSDFFKDYPTFFEYNEDKGTYKTNQFTLNQKIMQPQAAMTIIENKTGAIKAMAGGRKIGGRMLYNRAINPRQPGSSIKPLAVYGAALQKSLEYAAEGKTFEYTDNGFGNQSSSGWGRYITVASSIDDEPMVINGEEWPHNSYAGFDGLYTFRTAIHNSVNVCAVKIMGQIGTDYALNQLKKYGITSLDDTNDNNMAALALGGMTQGVSTLEMASAYTCFVNDGKHKSYYCYDKVTNRNGDVLLEPTKTETKALDPGVAWIMRNVLQTTVSEGICGPSAVSGEHSGGKSGTTNDNYDIWFCGFTASYTAALWIGNDENIPLSTQSRQASVVWGQVMNKVKKAHGGTYSKMPDNIVTATIDMSSGLLYDGSGTARKEYFTKGTEPTEVSTAHRTVQICDQTGLLATPSCPKHHSKSGIMRVWPANKRVHDFKSSLPCYYCNKHNPNPDDYPCKPGSNVTIVPIPDSNSEE